jgi:peroxiredoxin
VPRAELVPGTAFPDLVLPDHAGNDRMLSDLAAGDPLLLQFYRSWWGPKKQASFRNLQLAERLDAAYDAARPVVSTGEVVQLRRASSDPHRPHRETASLGRPASGRLERTDGHDDRRLGLAP